MAKHIKRFGLPVLLLAAPAALFLVPFARSDAPQDAPAVTPEQAQLAMSLRESIGFGPQDMLPAMSSNQQHSQMINAGLVFAVNAHADLQPLLDPHQEAEKQLVHALTWKASQEELVAAYQQVQQTRQALIQAVSQLTPQLQNILDQSDVPLVGVVTQNIDLDPELRTIALGEDQRSAIRQAMRQRDVVLKNAMNWHNRAKQNQARQQYEAALQDVLNDGQLEQLSANRQLLQDRLSEMIEAEMAVVAGEE